MDSLGRAVAIIISIILVLFLPMQYLYDSHYHQEHNHVMNETIAFTEKIRSEGALTLNMYEEFASSIGSAGSLYDIEIEVAKPFVGSANRRIEEKESKVLTTSSNKKVSAMTTASVTTTPKRVVSSLVIIPSATTVWNGYEPTYTVTVVYDDNTKVVVTNYTKIGFTKGSGVKLVEFSYTEEGKTAKATVEITVEKNTKVCVNGHTYEIDDDDIDYGCNICAENVTSIVATPNKLNVSKGSDIHTVVKVVASYLNGQSKTITDWVSDFDPQELGSQYVTITYQNSTYMILVNMTNDLVCDICGNTYPAEPDGSDGGCPICSKEIVSLKVTPSSITILKDTPLSITVFAVYKNGTSKAVTDWSSNFISSTIGKQGVTIFYQGKSTVIEVTVIADLIQCVTCGNNYSWKENPDGCPVCAKTIIGITARLKDEGTEVAYGSELRIDVVLIYKDGHREFALNGYTYSNFEPYTLGKQVVIVSYAEHKTKLEIDVVNNIKKVTCSVGHVYYLNEDGSDPGCPYCLNEGNGSQQGTDYQMVLMRYDILTILESSGILELDAGDYITIRVTYRKENKKGNFFYSFYNLDSEMKPIIYGGRCNDK